jgi:hypothetical protein
MPVIEYGKQPPERTPEVGLLDGFTPQTARRGRPPVGSEPALPSKRWGFSISLDAADRISMVRHRISENIYASRVSVSYSVAIEFLVWHWRQHAGEVPIGDFSPKTRSQGRQSSFLTTMKRRNASAVTPGEVRSELAGDREVARAGAEALAAALAAGLRGTAANVARLKAEDAARAALADAAGPQLTGRLEKDYSAHRKRPPKAPK